MTAWWENTQARQLTELYRALRQSRQLLPALDETSVETTRREKGSLRLRTSQDPVATVAPFRDLVRPEATRTDQGSTGTRLDAWMEKVQTFGPEPLRKTLSAFKNWRHEILAFFQFLPGLFESPRGYKRKGNLAILAKTPKEAGKRGSLDGLSHTCPRDGLTCQPERASMPIASMPPLRRSRMGAVNAAFAPR
jgi:hypothetical protein